MPTNINKDIINKFDVFGPRYTSYPTAPEWQDNFPNEIYEQKLARLGQSDKTISLYYHIPFCQKLCYFCACTMLLRPNDEKYGEEYLSYLFKEIDLVAKHLNRRKLIRQFHWGGGTPTFLTNSQIERLFKKTQEHFDIDFNSEVAIEVDPRTIDQDKLQLLRDLGFNRISMGVQDFDEEVMEAINRVQSFDLVKQVTEQCRHLGFDSINFDLIYGLPKQTPKTFQETMDKVVELKPDRIALYSYAYLPWMKKHQAKVDETQLPSADDKVDIFLNAREQFLNNAYQAIAMDHFALKTDEMAHAYNHNKLYRNFMGYTVKPADEYLGLGMSAIGFMEKAFIQNKKILKDYYAALDEGRLPIDRGKVLSEDDCIRQWTIGQLMCHFRLDKQGFQKQFKYSFDDYFSEEVEHVEQCVRDGLLEINGQKLCVTELGRIFIRNICMGFDWYLRQKTGHKKFSKTV